MKIPARTFLAVKQGDRLHLTAEVAYRQHLQAFGDGEEVEITLQPKRRRRTLAQNAAFYAALLQPWAEQEGHDIDDLKRDLLGTIFGWSEKRSPITKQLVPLKPHTSDLTVEEASIFIDRTLQIAAECGVLLLAPDEYRRQQQERFLRRGNKVA